MTHAMVFNYSASSRVCASELALSKQEGAASQVHNAEPTPQSVFVSNNVLFKLPLIASNETRYPLSDKPRLVDVDKMPSVGYMLH